MERDQLLGVNSETYGELTQEADRALQQRKKAQKEKEFNSKVDELADKYEEFLKTRGADDSLTQLLYNFLGVALEMKNMMETMKAINVAMECITDAVNFLDATLQFDQVLMDESLAQDYTFFGRMKLKAKMRKTIRNNQGRINAIADGLALKYKMSQDMMEALSKVSTKLAKKTKFAAKKAAKKGQPTSSATVDAYLASRQGRTSSQTQTTTTSAPSSAAGSIDDIL